MVFDSKQALLIACRRLLRPLARLLIKSGVPWKEFADVSKQAFVEIATDEFGIRGRPTNLARVAILTGINRREVARLRELSGTDEAEEPRYLNAAQRVLSGWYQDADYCVAGQPLLLPAEGAAPSFADLCLRHAGDMPATALLKELKAVAAVAEQADGRLQVLSRVYIPQPIEADSALRAGSVLEDLGNVLVHNLASAGSEPRRFERRAENDAIDPRHLPAFQTFLAREGQGFLERVDDWLTQHQQVDADNTEARRIRLGAGLYHIQDFKPRGRK
ncbi:MAG: DUF6502 family protein [Steroidobacteraceae bacterium]